MGLAAASSVVQTPNNVIETEPQIITVKKGEKSPEIAMEEILKNHPRGYVIVVFKAARQMFLAKDGKIVEKVEVKKSTLDKEYVFLKETESDKTEIKFPIQVALGGRPQTPRTRKGDSKTPEGDYFVCRKNQRGETNYTVALEVSYPNIQDAGKAFKERRITKDQYEKILNNLKAGKCPDYYTPLGGLIKIHGLPTATLNKVKKENPDNYRSFLQNESSASRYVSGEDWTLGCIAIEHAPLFYMLKEVPTGTPIIIKP